VIDFSVMKEKLCEWLEQEWDHKFLVWQEDPFSTDLPLLDEAVVVLPFNPTAEKLAWYLVEIMGPALLSGTGVTLIKCTVEETRKCSASYSVKPESLVRVLADLKEH
jgi:6-pyruvoyltetrahydropterin/6-carboxytetrahydropterin synthase